jgi:hypothetical protein
MNNKLYSILSIIVLLLGPGFFTPFSVKGEAADAYHAKVVTYYGYLSSVDTFDGTSPKAILISADTGERIELPVETQQQISALGDNDTQYETQYSIIVPTSILVSNLNEKNKWDSSYSVYGTLRQYWSERYSGSNRYVSVSKYEARWVLYDGSVRMSNSKMIAGCLGDFWDGGVCNNTQTYPIGAPTSGRWYTQTPSWAGRYVFVDECCFQAGNSEVTLKRGPTTTWYLYICVDEGSGC